MRSYDPQRRGVVRSNVLTRVRAPAPGLCRSCNEETYLRERGTDAPFCSLLCRNQFWARRGENPRELPLRSGDILTLSPGGMVMRAQERCFS
jgi:hypothetical protein